MHLEWQVAIQEPAYADNDYRRMGKDIAQALKATGFGSNQLTAIFMFYCLETKASCSEKMAQALLNFINLACCLILVLMAETAQRFLCRIFTPST